jgi:hypothetical protein
MPIEFAPEFPSKAKELEDSACRCRAGDAESHADGVAPNRPAKAGHSEREVALPVLDAKALKADPKGMAFLRDVLRRDDPAPAEPAGTEPDRKWPNAAKAKRVAGRVSNRRPC